MTATPWMKFFPADWRSDPKLRIVSMAARGLWIEMICIMHEAEHYGELTISGATIGSDQLARLVGESVDNVDTWLFELQSAGVFSIRKNGVIYSRRMEKDENKRRKLRENGKKGGNPSLCKKEQKQALDNQEDKTTESRSQKPEKKEKEKKSDADASGDRFEEFWQAYPSRPNNPKKPARQKFERAVKAGADPDQIIHAAKAFARERDGQDPRFTPMAQTWLNQERWEDMDSLPVQKQEEPRVYIYGQNYRVAEVHRMLVRYFTGSGRWEWHSQLGYPPGDLRCEIPEHMIERAKRESQSQDFRATA